MPPVKKEAFAGRGGACHGAATAIGGAPHLRGGVHMKPIAIAAVLLSTLVPLSVAVAEVQATYVFTTVDSYNIKGDVLAVEVTGIVQGEATPRTVTLTYHPSTFSGQGGDYVASQRTFDRCERLLLLAMSKPGQYLLELRQEVEPIGTIEFIGCKLTRR